MVAERLYTLAPTYRVCRDAPRDERMERLAFHIEHGDYFPFLATVIGFLKEAIEDCGVSESATKAAFASDMQKDLLYLQEHYRLAPLDAPTPYTKAKMVRFKP